jgi:hypothetical protein
LIPINDMGKITSFIGKLVESGKLDEGTLQMLETGLRN